MKQTVQFDDIDRRILALVQRDATLSNASLAEQVGASAASCWRRMRAMEDAGLLKDTVRLVDPEKLGLGVTVLCQVRLKSHNQEQGKKFEAFVVNQGEILECHSISGEWDYQLRIAVANVADYEIFLMHTLLRHPVVAATSSHFALRQVKYTTALPV
jgi:DNA-binding Lrp family transcriptional regulator